MTIKINTPVAKPSLVYDHIFMLRLRIKQEPTNNSTLPPKYDVQVHYRIYAVDGAGVRHFKKANYTVKVIDYLAAAEAKDALGDPRMLLALRSIEEAISQLITEKGTLGSTSVLPQ